MQFTRREFMQLMAGASACTLVPAIGRAAPGPEKKRTHPLQRYSPAELKKLKITCHSLADDWARFFPYATDMLVEGMKKHGLNITAGEFQKVDESADMVIVSGWYQHDIIKHCQQNNKNIIVVEPGYLQPRWEWPSICFNGLANDGIYPPTPDDKGERFNKYFGHFLKPWRYKEDGYILLVGQMPKDMSLHDLKLEPWLQEIADGLHKLYKTEIVFRPHPWAAARAKRQKKPFFVPTGCRLSIGPLEQDLKGASYTVMYSSTTAVESVLEGVPAVVYDRGSVAWDVSSHHISEPIYQPEREPWCHALAWKQWQQSELKDGTAWEHMQQAILI